MSPARAFATRLRASARGMVSVMTVTLVGRAAGRKGRRASDDEADELVLDEDGLPYVLAIQELANGSVGEGGGHGGLLGRATGELEPAAHLAIHLHHDFDLVLEGERRIERRPAGVHHAAGVAEPFPALLREMGRVGR